ncbi:MAG: hypothetical protein L0287_28725 [Anaerolineae bacterium]|nr:hypothetical protein [Anaerolineae bacterium]
MLGPITIGDSSVIGANSVVVKDLSPHSMAMGVPVRAISQAGATA